MLYCASCGRTDSSGANHADTITYNEMVWCTSCADVKYKNKSEAYIALPSPGRMYEGAQDDAINAWEDCYLKKAKKRILVKKAKAEIQRAWDLWDGNKSFGNSMFLFFCWLTKFRPYFLTFRNNGDPWQTIHGWLILYEEKIIEKR